MGQLDNDDDMMDVGGGACGSHEWSKAGLSDSTIWNNLPSHPLDLTPTASPLFRNHRHSAQGHEAPKSVERTILAKNYSIESKRTAKE